MFNLNGRQRMTKTPCNDTQRIHCMSRRAISEGLTLEEAEQQLAFEVRHFQRPKGEF
jgi:hypothetical protein